MYQAESSSPVVALRGIDLRINEGEYVAVVGHNGSGKSTLAKCLNGLLLPTSGRVRVQGIDTSDLSTVYEIRATVGVVFQNPDNQFVASTLREEVAFGPENLGVPQGELERRVEDALRGAMLWDLCDRSPRLLSAGQKARLAIASILAMRPACLVLDESTAMLDPRSRRQVLELLRRLHDDGLAIVAITHYMDEVAQVDRVLVLDQGLLAMEGSPREVFGQHERLAQLGLALPPAAALARGLRRRGLDLGVELLTGGELVAALTRLWATGQ